MSSSANAKLVICAAMLFACSGPDGEHLFQQKDPGELRIRAHLPNICPVFDQHFVVPHDIAVGAWADVKVVASDPDDADAELTFTWSSTSGSFSEPALPKTTYRCAATGAHLLTARARDADGCESELLLDVNCLEP